MSRRVEEYIENYTRNCSNELVSVQDKNGKKVISYSPWLTPDNARRAVEIAREEVIEEAVKWLKENWDNIGIKYEQDWSADEVSDIMRKALMEEKV